MSLPVLRDIKSNRPYVVTKKVPKWKILLNKWLSNKKDKQKTTKLQEFYVDHLWRCTKLQKHVFVYF